jgi:hypothetical protein
VANISKVEEFNSHFFNYLDGKELPAEWFEYFGKHRILCIVVLFFG